MRRKLCSQGWLLHFFSIVIKYLFLDFEMFVFMNHQFTRVFGSVANQIVDVLKEKNEKFHFGAS